MNHKSKQRGSVQLLLGLAILGVLAFVLITNIFDFKNRLFNNLYPKPASQAATASEVAGLHVSGNNILNSTNTPVRLIGVNRSGTEYMCINNGGFFDGPSDQASIDSMKSWGINAVRLPLNEDCWLNINGSPAAYSGTAYQTAIKNYVNLLVQNGIAPILELHWAAAGTTKATSQHPMPDRDHSIAFWSQVAGAFKDNSSVIFDLYNEPYPDGNSDTDGAWSCWRDGTANNNFSVCPGSGELYQAAGLQELLNAVRNSGATNIVMLTTTKYGSSFTKWFSYKPVDPLNNLVASWHVYDFSTFCNTVSCYDKYAAPVAAALPLIAGEIGESDCGHGFIDTLMNWSDAHNAGYLGWAWDTYDCKSFPALISNYNGTPTNFGIGFRDHVLSLRTPAPTSTSQPSVTPTPTPTPTSIPSQDTIVPNVTITSPVNGSLVKSKSRLTIQANATDNVGVARVEFYAAQNGGSATLICKDTTSPYSCDYRLGNGVNISYVLTAKAYDLAGNSATTVSPVRVTSQY